MSTALAAVLAQHAVILGSKSASRQAMLREMSVKFEVQTADIDEKAIRRTKPEDLVLTLAEAKAAALQARLGRRDGLLITADQVVVHDGMIREKPESAAEARLFISGYGRSPARTVGAIRVTNLASGKAVSSLDVAEIHFRPIPESVIEGLIEEGAIFHCAGGLMVENPLLSPLVENIFGTTDSIMGLNKSITERLLLEAAGVVQPSS